MSEPPSHLDLCCSLPADTKAVNTDLFEIHEVADGIYAAIAAPQYKVNSNAAIILTVDASGTQIGSRRFAPRSARQSKPSTSAG